MATRSLAGVMWALLIRLVLTVIVGRLLAQGMVGYYARLTWVFTHLLE